MTLAIQRLLEIPAAWASIEGLRDFLFNPLQLGRKWYKSLIGPIPARVDRIFQQIKENDAFLGKISFLPKIKDICEGPPPNQTYLVEGETPTQEIARNFYAQAIPPYLGFATKSIIFAADLLDQRKVPGLSQLEPVTDTISALSNLFLEWKLRTSPDLKLRFQEKILSNIRLTVEFLNLSRVALEQTTDKKHFQLLKLIISTYLAVLPFFSHFYRQWVIEPQKSINKNNLN